MKSLTAIPWITGAILIVMAMSFFPLSRATASEAPEPLGPFLWKIEFFNNPDLAGTPVVTWLDYSIGGNWGVNSPGLGIGADYFSARWSTTVYFSGGTYRLTLVPDDSVRVYLNNQLVVSTFEQPRPGQAVRIDHTVTRAGGQTIQIEYRENMHTASLSFSLERIASTPVVAAVPAGPAIGRVNANGLNVHAGPDYQYDVVVLSFRDWTMTLLGRNANSSWLKVQTHDGKVGWVEVAHIATTYPIISLPVVDGTQQRVSSPAQPTTTTAMRKHTVQSGETLGRIALLYGVNMNTLARINGITNINLIVAGQVLRIP